MGWFDFVSCEGLDQRVPAVIRRAGGDRLDRLYRCFGGIDEALMYHVETMCDESERFARIDASRCSWVMV